MRSRPVIHCLFTLCLVLTAALASVSHAQTPGEGIDDPPERVGRLSVVAGDVQAWDEARQAWQPAQLNLPVTSRSAFLSGPGARAEVTVGSAALRLDAESQANLLRLDDGGTDIEVPRGSVGIRLRAAADPAWQIASRGTVISLSSPGNYRIDVDPVRGVLEAKVFEGHAEIDVAGSRVVLSAGQQHAFELASGRPIGLSALSRTPFDDWTAQRDREQDRLQAWRYVSPEMTGADALDAAGAWRTDPSYGPVWYPNAVPAGWTPYSTGRWVWMPPWGWHWVDEAPWGFAPFHYGRWVTVDNRWGWVPGPYVRRPVYAPALVGFHGSGGRVSFAPAFGSTHGAWAGAPAQRGPVAGWFPLAPGETWHPPYRSSGGYVQSLNRGHGYVRGPSNGAGSSGFPGSPGQSYRYAQVPHASTVMPQSAVTGPHSAWSTRPPLPGGYAGQPTQGLSQGPAPGYRAGERGDRGERGERRDPGNRVDRDAMIRPPGFVAPPNPRSASPAPSAYAPPAYAPPAYAPPAYAPPAYAPPAQQAYGTPGRQVYAPPSRPSYAPQMRQADPSPVRPSQASPMPQGPSPRGHSGESARPGRWGDPAGGGPRGGAPQR